MSCSKQLHPFTLILADCDRNGAVLIAEQSSYKVVFIGKDSVYQAITLMYMYENGKINQKVTYMITTQLVT